MQYANNFDVRSGDPVERQIAVDNEMSKAGKKIVAADARIRMRSRQLPSVGKPGDEIGGGSRIAGRDIIGDRFDIFQRTGREAVAHAFFIASYFSVRRFIADGPSTEGPLSMPSRSNRRNSSTE